MLPIFGIGVLVAFLVDLVQVKWKVTTKPMKPKFSKLNPLSGFKRIFSMRSLVELLKSVLIIIITNTVIIAIYFSDTTACSTSVE